MMYGKKSDFGRRVELLMCFSLQAKYIACHVASLGHEHSHTCVVVMVFAKKKNDGGAPTLRPTHTKTYRIILNYITAVPALPGIILLLLSILLLLNVIFISFFFIKQYK